MKVIFKLVIIFSTILIFNKISVGQFVRIADRVIVAGYVFDESSSQSLPFVNVYVKSTRIGTITDTAGFFLLTAHFGDTLTISCLGYFNKYVVLTDSTADNTKPLIVFLDTRVYELKSVDIIALRRYKQFEHDFTNMKLPEDDYTYASRNFPFKPKDIDFYTRNDMSVAGFVFHPITAMYDLFSKEGKERRKLQELKDKDAQEEFLYERVNIDLIMKITKTTREETNLFLKWCNLSVDFISSLSEYELAKFITQKYDQYLLTK